MKLIMVIFPEDISLGIGSVWGFESLAVVDALVGFKVFGRVEVVILNVWGVCTVDDVIVISETVSTVDFEFFTVDGVVVVISRTVSTVDFDVLVELCTVEVVAVVNFGTVSKDNCGEVDVFRKISKFKGGLTPLYFPIEFCRLTFLRGLLQTWSCRSGWVRIFNSTAEITSSVSSSRSDFILTGR